MFNTFGHSFPVPNLVQLGPSVVFFFFSFFFVVVMLLHLCLIYVCIIILYNGSWTEVGFDIGRLVYEYYSHILRRLL